jgi:hypothetical protein
MTFLRPLMIALTKGQNKGWEKPILSMIFINTYCAGEITCNGGTVLVHLSGGSFVIRPEIPKKLTRIESWNEPNLSYI